MEILSYLWDADRVLVQVGDYPLSFLELAGTISGLAAVYLAVKANVLTWPVGIINQVFFFLLFYQVQLYSDMLLQLVFFGVSIWGWYSWQHVGQGGIAIDRLGPGARLWLLLVLLGGTAALGLSMGQIHHWLPKLFVLPAAFPYGDAFTSVASIIAISLQARKKLESWWLWIALDVVAISIYWARDIRFIAAEYVVFLLLSAWGLWQWQQKLRA